MNNYQFSQKVVDQFFEYDYHDRGMIKWQGFYLSDHTTAIKKQKAKNDRIVKLKPVQSADLIKQRLYYAFKNSYPVTIQLNLLNEERNLIELSNKIKNINDYEVMFPDNQSVSLEMICNVSLGKKNLYHK